MGVMVVDASAIAAVIFDEPEAAPIIASVTGPLMAPGLMRYELASICTTKIAREPQHAKLVLERYALLARLDVDYADPDWESLPLLARRWDISAYDAAYLQLALMRKAPLVTLDSRLARAYDRAVANKSPAPR